MQRSLCGQVLYVEKVRVNGTQANVVYFWANSNSDGSPAFLYAVDADNGAQYWVKKLNTTAQFQTETPVIDVASETLFFVTKNYLDLDTGDSGYGTQLLHAIDITNGNEKSGSPIRVDVSVKDTGEGSKNGVLTFSQVHSNVRPALLLANGIIYFAYAYNSDRSPYHGWIFGYSYGAGGFKQEMYFLTTPGGRQGGIWQGGKGLVSDGQNIYCSVANGDFDPSKSQYSMAVLKLTPQLKVEDYYTVNDYKGLSSGDQDTGNAGPLLIPGTPYLFIGPTKYGRGHVLDTRNMGKWVSPTQDTAHQTIDMGPKYHVPQQPIVWVGPNGQIYIYVWTESEPIYQYTFDKATGTVGAPAKSTFGDTSGGALSISSDGVNNGILWALGFGGGKLYALDATDITKPPLFNVSGGTDAHFGWVVVANGKVYSPSGGNLKVYGIK